MTTFEGSAIGVDLAASVADALVTPVTVTDSTGRIVWINAAAARAHGWHRDRVVGTPIVDVLPALADSAPVNLIENILKSGESWYGELLLNRADGSTYNALVTVSPVVGADGELRYAVASSIDTTSRRSIERRFRLGFDSVPHGWAFADLDGRVTECNPHYAKILGRPPLAIIGHSPAEFTYPADLDRATPFDPMLRGERPPVFTARKRYVRSDGDLRWVDVRVELVRDEDGKPEFFFGLIQDVTDWLDSLEQTRRAQRSYRALFNQIVYSLGSALGARDPYTAGHQHRVAAIAAAIAHRMGLDVEVIEGLGVGASLHDIGKVAAPAEILTKPGPLDDAERALVERHCQVGHDIVAGIDFPWPVAAMILQHHERLDGSGYPQGLTKDDIIVEARVLAVADTLESIVSHRPYRPGRPVETALEILNDAAGELFDPDVVDACTSLMRAGYEIPGDLGAELTRSTILTAVPPGIDPATIDSIWVPTDEG